MKTVLFKSLSNFQMAQCSDHPMVSIKIGIIKSTDERILKQNPNGSK